MHVSLDMVSKWRSRFHADQLAGCRMSSGRAGHGRSPTTTSSWAPARRLWPGRAQMAG